MIFILLDLFSEVSLWHEAPLSVYPARRLDRLRQVVPHAERANTASFLEEVITYIQGLQKRIAELEQAAAGGQVTAQPTIGQPATSSPALVAQGGFSDVPRAHQASEAPPPAASHSHGAGAQGPLDARDKFSFSCTAAQAHQEAPSAQPNTQPGTPPAVSGGHASEAGGASPASSEGCEGGVPLKKRRVVEGGSG
jgi:hypothetical protein